MADIEELIVRIKAAGVEQVSAALAQVEAKTQGAAEGVRKTGAATKEASHEFGLFRSPVLEALFAVRAFTMEIHETVAALGEISGVQVAAEYRHIANGLDQVTHSAKMTKEMMEQIEDMQTPYLNPALMNAIPQIVTAGTPASQAVAQLKDLSNMAALGNLDNSQFSGFVDQMERMRQMAHPEIRSLTEFGGVPITDIVNKAQGTKFTTANQADAYLQQLNGEQAYQVLLKGAHAMGAMAGAAMLLNDPAMALAKTMEKLHEIMLPTGAIFLKLLAPLIGLVSTLADWLDKLNNLTNGVAGLAAIILLVTHYWRILKDAFWGAIYFTKDLIKSLENYAETARAAATATNENTVAQDLAAHAAIGGSAGAEVKEASSAIKAAKELKPLTAEAKIFKWVKELPETLKAVKWAEIMPKMLEGALKIGPKLGDIVTLAAGFGIEYLGRNMKDAHGDQTKAGAVTEAVGNGIGWGGLGFWLGPIVGTIATVAMGAIFGAVGAHDFDAAKSSKDDALKKNTEALNAVTTSMRDSVVGGGDRARRMGSQLEVEYAAVHMYHAGVA